MNRILVDTHIFVLLLSGSEELTINTRHEIESCTKNEGQVLISAISIWEIGMLSQKSRITLKKPTLQWVKEALKAPYIYLAPLSPEIAIESCQLPGEFHGDPADRIIAATSRVLNVPLLTKDARIHEYAKGGYLECIAL